MRVLISGASGKIGKIIAAYINEEKKHEIKCLLVSKNSNYLGKEYMGVKYTSEPILEDIDMIIDFSSPDGLSDLLDKISNRDIPILVGTTGITENIMNKLHLYSKQAKVMVESNFSYGLYVMRKVMKILTDMTLNQGFDIEIIEVHHNKKKDAPSGTLLTLANDIIAINKDLYINYDRFTNHKPRDKNEIGISSIRGGNIFGEHEVQFINENEKISISHTAFNKDIFAKGSIIAAEKLFFKDAKNGFFDLIEDF